MASAVKIQGLDRVMKNLNKEIDQIKDRTMKGLIRASIIITRGMDKKIPVDLGNLRASRFTTTPKSVRQGKSPTFKGDEVDKLSQQHQMVVTDAQKVLMASKHVAIMMGFTAYYAWYVHEMVGATFQRGTAEAKFFESTLKEKKDEVLAMIAKEAKIKK